MTILSVRNHTGANIPVEKRKNMLDPALAPSAIDVIATVTASNQGETLHG